MATTTAQFTVKPARGGSFLIEERRPEDVFTPEDFTEEHRQIAKTAIEFTANEVLPAADGNRSQELRRHPRPAAQGRRSRPHGRGCSRSLRRPRNG